MATNSLSVEVIYADPAQQSRVMLELAPHSRVADALDAAIALLPIDDWRAFEIGIFGQVCSTQHKLTSGDRVEIYRPLVTDAKAARRARALQQSKA